MPVFRANTAVVYFAHIPKCGGASVEQYIRQRFGHTSFYDGRWREADHSIWYNSAPQHIPAYTRHRLFHSDFFDASFAMVRHPERRLMSAFSYNRHMKVLPWHMSLDRLLIQIDKADERFHLATDHHFLPMADFTTPDDVVFKLETDGPSLIDWFDQVSGDIAAPRSLPFANRGLGEYLPSANPLKNFIKKHLQPPVPEISKHLSERIYRLYRRDFDAFNYEPTFRNRKGHTG